MSDRRGGYTIVEVLVSMMVLSFGIRSLASTAGGITNMMYTGQRKTRSYAMAASVLDSIRNTANSTSPKCSAAMASGSGSRGSGFTAAWQINGAGASRQARVVMTYQSGRRRQADTLYASILC